jgi:hypothetical protein
MSNTNSSSNVWDVSELRNKLVKPTHGYNLVNSDGEIVSWYESRAEAIERVTWEYLSGRTLLLVESGFDA